MVWRIDMGQRDQGGTGLSISAPGQDVTLAGSRLIFSSDARFAQILFEGQLGLETKQGKGPPDPGSSVDYDATVGYGRWLFPRVLPFRPFCRLTYSFVEDDDRRYFVGQGTSFGDRRYIRMAPHTDSVEVFFRYERTNNKVFRDVVFQVAALNIPIAG